LVGTEKSLGGVVMWLRPRGRNREFNIGSPRSSSQHALSSDEHHDAMQDVL
jgi:hypothetical protein